MKKRTILKSLLILLPVLAVGLATAMDSVLVFDTVSGETQYYSYFDLIPVTNLQMVPPLAALCSVLSGILAAIFLGKKKDSLRKASGYAALAALFLAAIPPVLQSQVKVLPNVGLPIFMAMQYGVAWYLGKKPDVQETPAQKNRLPSRR